jgi:hypothetical protein
MGWADRVGGCSVSGEELQADGQLAQTSGIGARTGEPPNAESDDVVGELSTTMASEAEAAEQSPTESAAEQRSSSAGLQAADQPAASSSSGVHGERGQRGFGGRSGGRASGGCASGGCASERSASRGCASGGCANERDASVAVGLQAQALTSSPHTAGEQPACSAPAKRRGPPPSRPRPGKPPARGAGGRRWLVERGSGT